MENEYLLISSGGLPHRNLGVWSNELLHRLAGLNAGDRTPAAMGRLIGVTNEAALVEAHRGEYESARRICVKQLENLQRHPEACDFAIARYAVNPWLNLGRLASMSGRTAEACEMFALFRDSSAIATMAGVALSLKELNAGLRSEKGYQDFCAHVYAGNSLRALVRAKAWPAIVAFIASNVRAHEWAPPILDEARALSAMGLGRVGEALEITRQNRDHRVPHTRLTFRIREIECLALLGRQLDARTWTEVERDLQETLAGSHVAVGSLSLGLHLAGVALHNDERETAQRVAARCLAAAESLGDELYTYDALCLLSLCSQDAGQEYVERARSISAKSEYHRICDSRQHQSSEKRELADAACEALKF